MSGDSELQRFTSAVGRDVAAAFASAPRPPLTVSLEDTTIVIKSGRRTSRHVLLGEAPAESAFVDALSAVQDEVVEALHEKWPTCPVDGSWMRAVWDPSDGPAWACSQPGHESSPPRIAVGALAD